MGALTERDIEVLEILHWVNRESSYILKWARPLDLMGSNGSHHSSTLRKLEGKGLVQSKVGGLPEPKEGDPRIVLRRGQRGSRRYRITESGVIALKQIA